VKVKWVVTVISSQLVVKAAFIVIGIRIVKQLDCVEVSKGFVTSAQ
jgi:hypothetical protein